MQAEVLQIWNSNRTGPYVEGISPTRIAWTRVAENITEGIGDPSSGPNSAHLEFIIGAVSIAPILYYGENTVTGVKFSPATYSVLVLLSQVALTSLPGFGDYEINASGGTVTINPLNVPMIDLRFLTAEFDVVAAREAFKSTLTFPNAPPIFQSTTTGVVAPFTNVTTDAEIDNTLRNAMATSLHLVGTASMSPKGASWGVVDSDLSVKNVEGLRIVDASVTPFVPCAHIQVATYVITERAADLIRSSWK